MLHNRALLHSKNIDFPEIETLLKTEALADMRNMFKNTILKLSIQSKFHRNTKLIDKINFMSWKNKQLIKTKLNFEMMTNFIRIDIVSPLLKLRKRERNFLLQFKQPPLHLS